jgi:hypothetical protein
MGYRELHRIEIEEVVRRWQVRECQRAIARATGLARETVKKYLAAAGDLGLSATGPPPTSRAAANERQKRIGELPLNTAAVVRPPRDDNTGVRSGQRRALRHPGRQRAVRFGARVTWVASGGYRSD